MQEVDNGYRCAICGAELDVPAGADLRVKIAGASGRPNRRTLVHKDREVHSCEVPPAR